jgi:hypothetical protein
MFHVEHCSAGSSLNAMFHVEHGPSGMFHVEHEAYTKRCGKAAFYVSKLAWDWSFYVSRDWRVTVCSARTGGFFSRPLPGTGFSRMRTTTDVVWATFIRPPMADSDGRQICVRLRCHRSAQRIGLLVISSRTDVPAHR